MKLKNKKTGEIIEWEQPISYKLGKEYGSLAELNDEWEDVPTEEVWYLGERIGNYSMPKKEAREATEKILAWKRLEGKGFRFRWIDMQTGQIKYGFFLEKGQKVTRKDEDDLLLLFGGEE